MVLHELTPAHIPHATALFAGALKDPLLHATLEGTRPGRVWADDPEEPAAAFAWTGTECAYVLCQEDDPSFREAVRLLIVGEVLPVLKLVERGFLSLFAFPNSQVAAWEEEMAALWPWRTPILTFSFNREAYRRRRRRYQDTTPGMQLVRLDSEVLLEVRHSYLAEEIAFHWGTIVKFLNRGCGYGVLREGELASWCYIQARGAQAETVDIWTEDSLRRRGLGTRVAQAVIDDGLARGFTPFWLCDESNRASRGLAESLGFRLQDKLDVLDIPLDPYSFYQGLARHYYLPLGLTTDAAVCFERALQVEQGDAEDLMQTARAWALAGDRERALSYLREAAELGWEDASALAGSEAFEPLRGTEAWTGVLRRIVDNKRNGG